MTGIEHGDAGRKLIERPAMGIRKTRERAAHRFRFRGIHSDAGAAGRGLEFQDIEGAPRAGRNGAKPAGIGAIAPARQRDIFPRGAIEKFEAAFDRVG